MKASVDIVVRKEMGVFGSGIPGGEQTEKEESESEGDDDQEEESKEGVEKTDENHTTKEENHVTGQKATFSLLKLEGS